MTLRVLVVNVGLDDHHRGIKVVDRGLRDAGMEVVYAGLHQTPETECSAAKRLNDGGSEGQVGAVVHGKTNDIDIFLFRDCGDRGRRSPALLADAQVVRDNMAAVHNQFSVKA